MATDDIKNHEFWTNRYDANDTPWDGGDAHPFWKTLFKDSPKQDKAALVIGAGGGHDAQFLSRHFTKVIALDFSPAAKTQFERVYPDSPVEYLVKDFLNDDLPTADVVFEHTLLCAIHPETRPAYFKSLANVLQNGGTYHAITFDAVTHPHTDLPPFGTPFSEVSAGLASHNIEIIEEYMVDPALQDHPRATEHYIQAKKS